jgi:hypothetical protein
MSNLADQLHIYIDDYRDGIYAPDELTGLIIKLLTSATAFSEVWTEIPDWVQLKIWDFLKSCDEATVVYSTYSESEELIDSRLLALKKWLVAEMGYS